MLKSCIVIRNVAWPSSFRQFRNTDYVVNRKGEVWNAIKCKKLVPFDNGRGYKKVSIEGRNYYVQRLVAEVFYGKSDLQANHKNWIRDDNRADNVEWMTPSENQKHARKKPFWGLRPTPKDYFKDVPF